jgi:hypothetical protein
MTGHETPPAVLSEELVAAAAAAPPVTASSRTDDIPLSWDERAVLTTMLAYVRDTVHVKCAGLSDEQARRAPLPGSPLTSISSLVSHLRWVEDYWIRVILLGEPDQAPITEDDPDGEMRLGLSVPLTRLLGAPRTMPGVAYDRRADERSFAAARVFLADVLGS